MRREWRKEAESRGEEEGKGMKGVGKEEGKGMKGVGKEERDGETEMRREGGEKGKPGI